MYVPVQRATEHVTQPPGQPAFRLLSPDSSVCPDPTLKDYWTRPVLASGRPGGGVFKGKGAAGLGGAEREGPAGTACSGLRELREGGAGRRSEQLACRCHRIPLLFALLLDYFYPPHPQRYFRLL